MKKISSFFALFFLLTSANAQLDPFFFGTYIDDGMTSSYTIYTMDEVTEDCFIVEFEKYENFQTVFGSSGYGHCDGENGHMEIRMETDPTPLEVSFELDDSGFKFMTVYYNDSTIGVFKEFTEDISEIEQEYEEFYYSREDGAELLLFADGEGLGFTIFGLLEGSCEMNEISGELNAANEERTVFTFQDEKGCKIEFQISDGIIRIIEDKCDKYRDSNCTNWNGEYYLNE